MITLTKYGNADAAVIKFLRYLKTGADFATTVVGADIHPNYLSRFQAKAVLQSTNSTIGKMAEVIATLTLLLDGYCPAPTFTS